MMLAAEMSELHEEAVQALAEAIADRHPVMALTGPRGSGKSAVVAAVIDSLAGQPVSFLRVGNPLSTPLSLARLLIQLCGQEADETERDEAARVMRALRQRSGGESRAVIVVEQAESLLPPAVRLLHLLTRISDPSVPMVQVMFVGGESFWNLVQDSSFGVLRAQLATAVSLPAAVPVGAAMVEDPAPVLVATPAARLAERPVAVVRQRRWGVKLLVGLAAVAVLGVVFARGAGRFSDVAPVPQAEVAQVPVVPAPVAPAPAPAPVILPAAPGRSTPPARPAVPEPAQPVVEPPSGSLPSITPATRRQLRQQFDAFLRQSRSDIAGLTAARRDELFEQYLARYLQQEQGRGAPTQPFTPSVAAAPAEPPRRPAAPVSGRRVVIHYKSTSDAARIAAARMSSTLDASRTELRPVDNVPRQPSVRYYTPEDRDAAQQLAAMLDTQERQADGAWDVQDFSSYRPRPSAGTLEVWLPPS